MFTSCHGGRHRCASRDIQRGAALGSGLMLSLPVLAADGATGGTGYLATALVALLAMAAVGVIAYLLGATRSRLRSERALREARAEARLQTQLIEGRPWQSDALHRLASEPGGTDPASESLLGHPEVQAKITDALTRIVAAGRT